jgi:hypothetical protein
MHISSALIAAAASPTTDLFSTPFGRILVAILRAVALIILLIGATKAISSFTSGTPGKGAKIIIGTAVVCAFLFNPSMAGSLISFMSSIVEAVISSGDAITKGASNTVTPTTIPGVVNGG